MSTPSKWFHNRSIIPFAPHTGLPLPRLEWDPTPISSHVQEPNHLPLADPRRLYFQLLCENHKHRESQYPPEQTGTTPNNLSRLHGFFVVKDLRLNLKEPGTKHSSQEPASCRRYSQESPGTQLLVGVAQSSLKAWPSCLATGIAPLPGTELREAESVSPSADMKPGWLPVHSNYPRSLIISINLMFL